ncbi:MAG TPA: hypothetical protein VGB88_07370 [Alphaproteobacteria bacterium]
MPSAKRSWTSCSGARCAAGAAIGLALLVAAIPNAPPVHADIAAIAPPRATASAGPGPLTLDYHPGEFGDLRREVFLKQVFRGVRNVVRGVGRVVGEVAKGTVKGAGEIGRAAAQVAQVPGEVGQKVGREVGGFVGGMVGGRRGRKVGRNIGGLAGTYYGGKVASRSSLIETVNRAQGKAEQIAEMAARLDERRERIRRIFEGDIGGLAREELERRLPTGVIQDIRPNVPTMLPPIRPTPSPPPVRVEGRF